MRTDDLHVNPESQPDWITGKDRLPSKGELVLCASGMAEVVKVCGKTGDGSRLLELRLVDQKAPPFFAAASNVLVPPLEAVPAL